MITINENVLGKAYMLDKHDNLINVKYHPYGDMYGDIEDNTSCAYFLYLNSNKNIDKIERMLLMYISYCFQNSCVVNDYWDLAVDDSAEFKIVLGKVFIEFDVQGTINGWNIDNNKIKVFNTLYDLIIKCKRDYEFDTVGDIAEFYNDEDNVEAYLQVNEDYTRVRVGGRYDSDGEDCIYFRISSVAYDWGEDIMNIVFKKFANTVNYITIERDMESTNINKNEHKVYKTKDGQLINHLPIKDFIYQEHIPLVASLNKDDTELFNIITKHTMIESRKYIPKSIILREYKRLMYNYFENM